jgi:DNA modification methylase
MNYDQVIASKIRAHQNCGFSHRGELARKGAKLRPFDWQEFVIKWALEKGRAALFEDCGLGKTGQQVIWADEVRNQTFAPVLILCPLAVAAQTVTEAALFGVEVTHVRQPEHVTDDGIFVTNYDRLEFVRRRSIPRLSGVVLDESSILKSFTGKTRRVLTDVFSKTPYRLACTATPAPNDFTELGQHAEFLGVMRAEEMLATWFINDTFDTGTWRLKKHAEEDFWRWVASWAACISKPSDLGFSDDGYELPALNLHQHVGADRRDQRTRQKGSYFAFAQRAPRICIRNRGLSIEDRVKVATELALSAKRTGDISGANSTTRRTRSWKRFRRKSGRSPRIGSAGAQGEGSSRCSRMATDGSSSVNPTSSDSGSTFSIAIGSSSSGRASAWSANIRRSAAPIASAKSRPSHVHFIVPSTLGDVRAAVRKKFDDHALMQNRMKAAAKVLAQNQQTEIVCKTDIDTASGKNWELHHGDCVRVAKEKLADESIGFSVFSPPFADLFTYSNDQQDMGNCRNVDEFMVQFGFLIEELQRVMMPGREIAVHCCDLMSTKWKDGAIELKDFSGQIAAAFRAKGFLFHSRITIWKSPVTEMQRTKSHGLLYKTLKKDSSDSRVGAPDYLLVFRKRGDNPKPIEQTPSSIPLDLWQELASPVWMTVNQSRVLNGKDAKEKCDERHICPLQLDVIERALRLWSAPGDLVFSPFTGIGSEGYCALRMGRKFVGAELKGSYFKSATERLQHACDEQELALV